ncbi:MAG: mandelate racemase/muconate lactonizing enzyme family protein, partial [Dehalococcoidia bacterium]|nr:mandelate racemase/muconate lactonizing enzyme family protein [Dehalococcoidia bacterium]
MKIKSVRAVQINAPSPPVRTKTKPGWNKVSPRSHPIARYSEYARIDGNKPGQYGKAWVQITAEDGTFGLGSFAVGVAGAAVVDYLIAPLIEGKDALATELINDQIWRMNEGFQGGIATAAQSGIDLALWDLKGKLLGRPVYELIGGPSRDHVELYATGDDIEWMHEIGFTRFKISNPFFYEEGSEGLARLEDHVASQREIAGDDAELTFNPTMSYNADLALRVAERLRPYKLRWFEEPLPPWDLEGYKELKRAMTWTALATGEHHYGRKAFQQLIAARAVDIVQPDIEWVGGLSEVLKIYTYAEAAGIETITHTGANTAWGQHFAYAMPETTQAEWFMNTDVGQPISDKLLPGIPAAVDGKLVPSNAPG